MRDVSSKYHTLRTSRARALLTLAPDTVAAIRSGSLPKADPIGVARIAGIQAAKNTASLIPYCHQVPLDHVSIDVHLDDASATITAEVKAIWKTGVEMEALTAASVAALTLYDMLKPIDETMEISGIRLLEKTGGKSSLPRSGKGLRAGVLVMSDTVSSGRGEDRSGSLLKERLIELGIDVVHFKIIPDEIETIKRELRTSCESLGLDLMITTGGTGVGPRDVTPEATASIIETRIEGVEEALRRFGQERHPTSMLSRGIAGRLGRTLILNLPGSPGAVVDGINALFPAILHAFGMMRGERHD
jgi:molybdenum cofactor biosynthesis protein MoaC